MALIFCESFDHYSAVADAVEKGWSQPGGTTSQSVQTTAGRRGGGCYRIATTNQLQYSFAAAATMTFGVAFKIDNLPASATGVFRVLDSATTHLEVQLNTNGTFSVYRGAGTTLLGTSTNSITGGVFNYIEIRATIDDANGAFELRVNGTSTNWLALTSQDTRNGGNATMNGLQFRGVSSRTIDLDDFYACDTSGSSNTTFLGDVRVDAYLPSGNGNSSQFSGSDGNSTDNYLLVDESAPDDDTTYVESSTAGHKDTYTFPNMSHTPANIFGVQLVAAARKDDAGTRSLATVVRSGGTDTDGSTQALATTYAFYRQIHETDPNTSAAWTKSGYDAAEFGVKVAV